MGSKKIQKAAILGATSDMAKAFAHILAKEKIPLILVARDPNKLEPIIKDIQIRYQVPVQSILFDMEKDSIDTLLKQFNEPFDLFISFVGYLGEQSIAQTSSKEVEKIVKINYTVPALILDGIANRFIQWKKEYAFNPVIVGVSSVAGDRGRQSNYWYGSAKSAFSAYLSGLRNRLYKEEIHVLTVKPGFVRTSMTENMELPPLFTAEPEEVAMDIYKAIRKRKDVLYTRWFWRYIMLIIRWIPEKIFKRLSL